MSSMPVILLLCISILTLSSVSLGFQSTRRYLQNFYCNTTQDCQTQNSICHTGRCMCSEGYIPDKDSPKSRVNCIKEATFIGDFCNKNIQCSAAFGTYSECKFEDPSNIVGRCHCNKSAHFLNGICYKTAYIGESCEVSDNCLIKSKDVNTFCDHSRCICPPYRHSNYDGTDCLPSSEIGGPCDSDIGCIILNSRCESGFCICKPGYILDTVKRFCLKVSERLESPCKENKQCNQHFNHTICNTTLGVCQCESGSHKMNDTCWKNAKLLEPCSHNFECKSESIFTTGIHCSGGLCQCEDDFLMEDRKYCVKNIKDAESGGGYTKASPILLVNFFSLRIIWVFFWKT